MSYVCIQTRAQIGLDSPSVSVEVHLANGLPCFHIVGLPEMAVRESRERVRAAIINSHFQFPSKRITVNLAPAELPKQGGRFDLAIAIGLLLASEQIRSQQIQEYEFIGELSLSGKLLRSHAVLPSAHQCANHGNILITAWANQSELQLLASQHYLLAHDLLQVCAHIHGTRLIDPVAIKSPDPNTATASKKMSDVLGQEQAKRALIVAASGHHHVLMVGSPGSGKTMLANRFMNLLSLMSVEETIETASLYSLIQHNQRALTDRKRPFRAPHHTVSAVGLAGGGTIPQPGEISLAHNGVLFLDEFIEFSRASLEILREPIETGHITISRAAGKCVFPARFQLIAAMNPCPMGCDLNAHGQCQCSQEKLQRYLNKLSAPLLDRIDIRLNVPKIPAQTLLKTPTPTHDNEQHLLEQIHTARKIQLQRQGHPNALLSSQQCQTLCPLTPSVQQKLLQCIEQFKLTARGSHQVLKLARTIADLENSDNISMTHLAEAIAYRQPNLLQLNPS